MKQNPYDLEKNIGDDNDGDEDEFESLVSEIDDGPDIFEKGCAVAFWGAVILALVGVVTFFVLRTQREHSKWDQYHVVEATRATINALLEGKTIPIPPGELGDADFIAFTEHRKTEFKLEWSAKKGMIKEKDIPIWADLDAYIVTARLKTEAEKQAEKEKKK